MWPSISNITGLSDHQRDTISPCLASPIWILAGTPGTGKTYSAAAVLRALVAQEGAAGIAVAAPTGKAAVRITAAMAANEVPIKASTIHRMLGCAKTAEGWQFAHHARCTLLHSFIVIDEVSMLDTSLAAALLTACAPGTHVLLIGDPYQLPPVGHGAPLRDMIRAGVPCAELTEIQRNAGDIVRACVSIKNGEIFTPCTSTEVEEETGKNLCHIGAVDGEKAITMIKGLFHRWQGSGRYDPVWGCQVIVPVNRKSTVSRKALNEILQDVLNPNGKKPEGKTNPFRVGDKLICLKNSQLAALQIWQTKDLSTLPDDVDAYHKSEDPESHFVANGDVGRVLAVDEKRVAVRFDSPERWVIIPVKAPHKGKGEYRNDTNEETQTEERAAENDNIAQGAAGDFDLAYAVSCHKFQGSECPCVIVIADDEGAANMVCGREWWYTAISRAKQLCIVIGKMQTVSKHCRRERLSRRKTFLKELLMEGAKGGSNPATQEVLQPA